MLRYGLGPWRSRFIYILDIQFLNKNPISFSARNSKINRRLIYSKHVLFYFPLQLFIWLLLFDNT
jgi:hypothetical protein